MRTYHEFSLFGEVTDLAALFEAAKRRAVEDGMSETEADEYCRDADGEVCARHCLTMLLDPGSLPGFEIQDSCTE